MRVDPLQREQDTVSPGVPGSAASRAGTVRQQWTARHWGRDPTSDSASLLNWLIVPCSFAVALVLGALASFEPKLALGALVFTAVVALALYRPVTHLLLLIFITAIVPLGIQNQFSLGGGIDSPGIAAPDVFLLTGLLRAALVLPTYPLHRRRFVAGAIVLVFLCMAALQFAHGFRAGRPVSAVAAEFRALLGFATVLLALPSVGEPADRERLMRGLLFVGLALGLWAVVQWNLNLDFGGTKDFGVRQGVNYTSAGQGQLQGGMFAFPVAALIAVAVLAFGNLRSVGARSAVMAVLLLNLVGLVLTYERTFWIASFAGLLLIAAKASPTGRKKLLLWAPIVSLLAFLVLSTVGPSTLATAKERLISVGNYATDESVRYRVIETGLVLDQVRERPIIGTGLGATVFLGGSVKAPPEAKSYTHNGYSWLAWKAGLPAAALLWLLLGACTLLRTRHDLASVFPAVAVGSQAGLLALLIATFAFPSFDMIAITPTIGLLVALTVAPSLASRSVRA
jgi:hypothetical protein